MGGHSGLAMELTPFYDVSGKTLFVFSHLLSEPFVTGAPENVILDVKHALLIRLNFVGLSLEPNNLN